MTYAWAKRDDDDRAYHGHDSRSRRIALRYIAEYLGGENTLGEKSTWRTHHGKVRAEGPSGPPRHAECWHARQVQVVGGRKQRALADACMSTAPPAIAGGSPGPDAPPVRYGWRRERLHLGTTKPRHSKKNCWGFPGPAANCWGFPGPAANHPSPTQCCCSAHTTAAVFPRSRGNGYCRAEYRRRVVFARLTPLPRYSGWNVRVFPPGKV